LGQRRFLHELSDRETQSLIDAETESNNKASHRVLEKAGFHLNGVMGEEGPDMYLGKFKMEIMSLGIQIHKACLMLT
jgi:RimJ/RimL family protein N-acetyltransferase